ncbi:UxaA family hydrolase [Paracoccus lutimaris]|uniref:SAF domain-containing protein n=1 Tax=Paracoccus lutimaris TaxID=1490030 RepID=A0A368Z3I7_9RHOB|nr:UxaA family hydrolase [Paracoccus lutimaris]RCW87022.1 SAF domain-containing protein [Paracoccus lutimaris]
MQRSDTDPRLMLLAADDSVYVLRDQIAQGESITVQGRMVAIPQALGLGHKIARRAHRPGDKVVKYGAPIGSASTDIAPGEHVHTHNLKSDYTATHTLEAARSQAETDQEIQS